MNTILVAYIPVLHMGYVKFFESLKADTLYLIGEQIISDFPELDYIKRKDSLRAIPSSFMVKTIESLGLFRYIYILDSENAISFCDEYQIIMPDEDISRVIAERYLKGNNTVFKPIFLRWHRDNVLEQKTVQVHRSIKVNNFDREIMLNSFTESERSMDWWRQVGALIVKDGESILVAHNKHMPDEQMPYVFGDPRSVFKKGVYFELSTAHHAEAILIAEAARRGIKLEGAYLYVTDFPCPPCAKLIAHSGIKRCYFTHGYATLDGENVLKSNNVELIYVQQKEDPSA